MGYCICAELLAGKMSSCAKLGEFFLLQKSPAHKTKDMWVWVFSSSQLINNKLWKWWFHLWQSYVQEWTSLIFLMRILQTRHFENGLMEIRIFFIASLETCCPFNCCLCFLSPNFPVENILLILCSNLTIFLLSGLVRKVGVQMEIKKSCKFVCRESFYGATLVGQWQLLLQQLKKYRTSLCIMTS